MTPAPTIHAILILIVSIAMTSCNIRDKKGEPVWSDLPDVKSLDSLQQTDFVATLENPISENKNIIYAPAFLYAWDKMKEELGYPVVVDNTNSPDFKLLNQSISYQNSLTDTEYSVTAKKDKGSIAVEAFFNKTLPFKTKLQVSADPMLFDGTKVSAFGMHRYDKDALEFTEILYYKDDNNFVLKLTPKDIQQEIILVKDDDKYQTLNEAIKLTDNLIAIGKQEQTNDTLFWKYDIHNGDIFSIPVIKFNIKTNYKNLEGQIVTTSLDKYYFKKAYQRTGLILNENGAVVESKAVQILLPTSSMPVAYLHPHKKMIFDRPFLIIIKRADKINPYFVMKVANTELMMRQ